MRSDLVDITVVMDRSGSMSSCRLEAERGLNDFIGEQRSAPGDATFTLMQFNSRCEYMHRAVPIRQVPQCGMNPAGTTALLDAVGTAITDTGTRLRNMPENQRPGLVIFVIVTDGQENASREYNKARIREMITHQRDCYNWQFTFLGANQDAFAEAEAMGIDRGATANYAEQHTGAVFMAAAHNVRGMRKSLSKAEPVANFYSNEVRESLVDSTPK